MPQSKKRTHHHQFVPPPHKVSGKKNHAIIYVSVIFFCLLGIGISYFSVGPDNKWLALGGIGGALAGYFFGKQIDKSITK